MLCRRTERKINSGEIYNAEHERNSTMFTYQPKSFPKMLLKKTFVENFEQVWCPRRRRMMAQSFAFSEPWANFARNAQVLGHGFFLSGSEQK